MASVRNTKPFPHTRRERVYVTCNQIFPTAGLNQKYSSSCSQLHAFIILLRRTIPKTNKSVKKKLSSKIKTRNYLDPRLPNRPTDPTDRSIMAGIALSSLSRTTQGIPGNERLQQLQTLALGEVGGGWKSGLLNCCFPCTSNCVLGFYVPCLCKYLHSHCVCVCKCNYFTALSLNNSVMINSLPHD